jgi:hypothetical protein
MRAGYLRRHVVRGLNRQPETVWSVGEAGAEALNKWLAGGFEEQSDISVDFLEHHLFCAELFVGLLADGLADRVQAVPSGRERRAGGDAYASISNLYARVEGRPWIWTPSGGGLQLPWQEYDGMKSSERRLTPDAMLDLPKQLTRIFVEAETGSQPLTSKNKNREGATFAKLTRYNSYFTTVGDLKQCVTWYTKHFPDNYTPELLILVQEHPRRVAHTQNLVNAWVSENPRAGMTVRVETVAQAVARLRGRSILPAAVAAVTVPQPPPGVVVTREALEMLEGFFESMRADIKMRQKEEAELRAAKKPYRKTFVPNHYEEVKALIAAYKKALGIG